MAAPAIGIRRRWAPRPMAVIDWSHPIAQGLVWCVVPGVRAHVDLVSGAERTTGAAVVSTSRCAFGATGIQTTTSTTSGWGDRGSATQYGLVAVGRQTASNLGGAASMVGRTSAGGAINYLLSFNSGTSNFSVGHRGSSAGSYYFTTGQAVTLNTDNVFGASYDGSNVTAYVNGAQVATASAPVAPTGSASDDLGINRNQGTNSGTFDLVLTAVWNRALTAAEHARLNADPFCFLRF